MSKQVAAFSFEDLGVNSPSYFQGAGTASTNWDEVFVGVGDTAREAAKDALENYSSHLAPSVLDTMEDSIDTFDDKAGAHAECVDETNRYVECNCEDEGRDCLCHDDCELNHYVALYVRYAEESAPIA